MALSLWLWTGPKNELLTCHATPPSSLIVPCSSALLYHSSPTSMSNICTKSELPVYPFATQSSALLICSAKGQRGESKRENRESKRRERDRENEVGKGRRSLSLTKKRSARGSLTVNIAGSSPSPYATANLHFLLSNFLGWQRCQTTRSQHWKFAWLDRKSCFRSERSRKGEREEERGGERFTEKSRQKEIILNAA